MARAKKGAPQVPDQTTENEAQASPVVATSIIMVALNQLRLSDINVRKTDRDAYVPELADNIAANGLKQNLIVTALAAQEGLHSYEVIAGGRRFQALQLLEERGHIPFDFAVPVTVERDEDAVATSLDENMQRVAMNPVDEFQGYRDTIDGWLDTNRGAGFDTAIAACAKRFGKSIRHVEQRLRLAALAPAILDALRDGDISLEAARAYAATADDRLQMDAWEGLADWGRDDPHRIRDALAKTTITSTDRLAIFVGRLAYSASGGCCERDLFAAEGVETWLDRGLVVRLAQEKLGEEAIHLETTEGWGEVRPLLDRYVPHEQYSKMSGFYGNPTKAQKAKCVRFLLIDDKGATKLDHSTYTAHGAMDAKGGAGADGAERPISQAAIDRIAMDRRDVLAATIIDQPDLAADLLIFQIALGVAGSNWATSRTNIGIKVELQNVLVKGWEPTSAAGDWLKSCSTGLDRRWLDAGGEPEKFMLFRALEPEAKQDWLAFCVAQSLHAAAHNARGGFSTTEQTRFIDMLGAIAGVDVRALWRPTADNYFKRVDKPVLLRAAEEMGADITINGRADMKKGALAQWCEGLAQDTAFGSEWVPDLMKFADAPPVVALPSGEDDAASEGDVVADEVDEAA